MRDRKIRIGISAATLAVSLLAGNGGAQTAGQAKAAQALAGQAKSGAAAPAPASASRPATTSAKAASSSAAVAAKPAAAPSAAPAKPPAAAAPGAAPQAPAAASAPSQTTVPSGSRRDPFRPLVIKGKSDELPAKLPPGKAGLVIGQLTIQGIVRGMDGQWIAVADNKTKRAYFLYAGDDLYNGTVTRITENSVVFAERVTDPTGKVGSREVVKQLVR